MFELICHIQAGLTSFTQRHCDSTKGDAVSVNVSVWIQSPSLNAAAEAHTPFVCVCVCVRLVLRCPLQLCVRVALSSINISTDRKLPRKPPPI